MATKRRVNEWAAARRDGANTDADGNLYERAFRQRAMMRSAARQHPGEAGEAFRNEARHYDLLLKHGEFFTPSPRPKPFKKGRPNECLGSSQDLVTLQKGLIYCEGVIFVGDTDLTVEHGWCVDGDGDVIDVTLDKPSRSYFGIKFDRIHAIFHDVALMDDILLRRLRVTRWKFAGDE